MEIKINTLKLFFGLWVLLIVAACTKQNTDNMLANEPVVQSYLIAGQMATVKLYQQKALTDTAQYGAAITGQKVYISDGSKNVLLTESTPGVYTYSDLTFLAAGKTYSLQFTYLGYSVSASTVMPAQPQNFAIADSVIYISSTTTTPNSIIDTLDNFTWTNPDSLNHVIVFKTLGGAELPIFGSRFKATTSSANINYEINTNRTSKTFITQYSLPYYSYYQVILYRVNPEYINLVQSNNTSATSQTLLNTYTNITNGLGIFTAMNPATAILYLRVYST